MPLDTPSDLEELYLARGADDVDDGRPIFTGDVLLVEGGPMLVLQHPCAIRRGASLTPHLLVAPCATDGPPPKNWHGHFKKMPLPDLHGDGQDWSADFFSARTIPGVDAEGAPRIAQLSEVGINVLMQRWVYHNTRVIVPTEAFHEALAPQHAEAELQAEWVFQSEKRGHSRDEAVRALTAWLVEDDRRRALALINPQKRAAVRRELLDHWR